MGLDGSLLDWSWRFLTGLHSAILYGIQLLYTGLDKVFPGGHPSKY